MATWVLAADFRWKDGLVLKAGKILDDTLFPVTAMQAAGAQISPTSTASLAASAVAQKNNANGVGNLIDVGVAVAMLNEIANSLSGVDSSGNITPATLTWPANVVNPTITQAAPTNANGQNITIAPQTSNGTGTQSGSLVLNVAPPATGANEAGLWLERSGTLFSILSTRPSFPTISSQWWFGPNAATASTTNYVLEAQVAVTQINNPSKVSLAIGGAEEVVVKSTGVSFSVPVQGTTTFQWGSQAIALTAGGGTTTLNATQQAAVRLVAGIVTLSGGVTIDFGNVTGFYLLNLAAVTLGGQTVSLKNGTTTIAIPAAAFSVGSLIVVDCSANAIAIA